MSIENLSAVGFNYPFRRIEGEEEKAVETKQESAISTAEDRIPRPLRLCEKFPACQVN